MQIGRRSIKITASIALLAFLLIAVVPRATELYREFIWQPPDTGAVHAAARDGDVAALSSILAANRNLVDAIGCDKGPLGDPEFCGTPIDFAVGADRSRSFATARLLLQYGASLRGAGGDALILSVDPEDETTVPELLIRHGADVNLSSLQGETPLYRAAQESALKTAETLIRAGATIDAKADNGETPLCAASDTPNGAYLVRFLTLRGANVNVHALYGRTPLHFAVGSGSLQTVAALIGAGAGVNATDESGGTPLHELCEFGSTLDLDRFPATPDAENKMRFLLAHGADPNALDHDGKSPLVLARLSDNRTLAAILQIAGGR